MLSTVKVMKTYERHKLGVWILLRCMSGTTHTLWTQVLEQLHIYRSCLATETPEVWNSRVTESAEHCQCFYAALYFYMFCHLLVSIAQLYHLHLGGNKNSWCDLLWQWHPITVALLNSMSSLEKLLLLQMFVKADRTAKLHIYDNMTGKDWIQRLRGVAQNIHYT